MRYLFVTLALLCITSFANAQGKYEISVNLLKVKKDRVKVVVKTPEVKEDNVDYVIPAVIPGSYSRKDFGRFYHNVVAYNKKGKKMTIERDGPNIVKISDAKTLDRIEYWVDDTWDAPKDNFVFQPGGTNIDKGNNYVINHQGFYGYLEGYKMLPYEVTFKKPDNHWTSTPLRVERDGKFDKVFAPSYVQIVDNPVMICEPDTTSIQAGNMKVHISCYSENNVVPASLIKEYITPMAEALESFFGTLPVDNYHFIMYFPNFTSSVSRAGGFGALEHSYGSFYFLPEMQEGERLRGLVQGVASHEFLHILTPLNIHSEEIEFFDFRDPKMSQHLWMYEGVTEYFANLVQVREGLMTYKEFIKEMNGKIKNANKYITKNDGVIVSFTEMSRNILTDEYKDLYNNVYEKGALIGFLLDIRLKELSSGQEGLRELMMALAERYGPSVPFKDDELIDVIVELSHPEIRDFFDDYVVGNEPLPYKEYFAKIGWQYDKEVQVEVWTFGRMGFGKASGDRIAVNRLSKKNALNLKVSDVILSVNGVTIDMENQEGLEPLIDVKNDDELTVVVLRGGTEKTLTSRPNKKKVKRRMHLQNMEKPTAEQMELRKAVLKQY